MAGSEINTVITAFGILFVMTNAFLLGLRIQVGENLRHFFVHWKLAARVLLINFVLLPLLTLGITALVNLPADVKIGFCIAALAAGAPFAPLLTRLAKGDTTLSTMLFVVLVLATVIVVPLVLSPVVTAIVPGIKHIPIWSVLWPFLLFLLVPLALGCLLRLRYSEHAQRVIRPLTIVEITSLLLYINVFITAYLHLFGRASGVVTYVTALVVPIVGIILGGLISRNDTEARHATTITTAQRSVGGAILVTIFNYPQPLANVAVTIINTIGIVILLILSLEWGRAYKRSNRIKTEAAA